MFKINKGVDRPPEVMGVRGMNFLQLLAGGVVGGLVVSAILIAAVGLDSLYTFSAYLVLVFIFYQNIVRLSKRYGEKGYARYMANMRIPGMVTVHSSRVFHRLMDGKPTKRRKS